MLAMKQLNVVRIPAPPILATKLVKKQNIVMASNAIGALKKPISIKGRGKKIVAWTLKDSRNQSVRFSFCPSTKERYLAQMVVFAEVCFVGIAIFKVAIIDKFYITKLARFKFMITCLGQKKK